MAKIQGQSANAAALVGFLIACCGVGVTTCGVIWAAYGGYTGHGLWSGIPLLVTGFFGLLSLTRKYGIFIFYLLLSVLTSIGAGIQAVTGGLELRHWSKFIGDKKCSVTQGSCRCIGQEQIRIKDLDSCDKIPTINDLFITIIFFSICGALLCIGGAIAGCIGLTTVPRSQPTTLPRKPKSGSTPSSTLMLQRVEQPPANKQRPEVENHDQRNSKPYTDEKDYFKEKDRYSDRRSDDYPVRDGRDDYYDGDRYDRRDDYPDRRDDYYDREKDYYPRDDRYRDDYSDRSYDRRSYDRRSYDGDYDRDYYNRTPPPDDKTYL